MRQPSRLILDFVQKGKGPLVLDRTRFAFRESAAVVESRRGLYGKAFKWSAGVKALAYLLLKSAAQLQRRAGLAAEIESYVLRGHRRTPAASLNDALTKAQQWMFDMFGNGGGETPLLRDFICRANPDFNTDKRAPVELWLDSAAFPAEQIEVRLNGERVRDAQELDRLAEEIARHWPSAAAPAAVDTLEPADANGAVARLFQNVTDPLLGDFLPEMFNLSRDDVVFELIAPDDCPMRGRWQGKSAVQEVVVRNFSQLAEHETNVHTTVCHADRVVVMMYGEGIWKPGSQLVGMHGAYHIRFVDGRIAEILETLSWDLIETRTINKK